MGQQTLQIGGNENVHGGRSGLVELPAGIITTGGDEVRQHVVFVGGAHQAAHRQPHLFGVPACQNIPEVAGGHTEIHRFAPLYRALPGQTEVGIEIVDDLRHQTAEVDGVGAGQADAAGGQSLGHIGITEHPLDAGLGIVKVSGNRVDAHVVTGLGGHLQALNLAGARVGIEHLNFNAVQPGVARQRRLAGIAAGRHQNPGGLGALQAALALHQQAGHQLQRIVLEGTGGAVPQLQRIQAIPHLDGPARVFTESRTVGGLRGRFQKFRGIIRQKARKDLFGQFRVAEVLPALQIRLGEIFGYVQAAARSQTAHDGLGGIDGFLRVTSAVKFHKNTSFNPPQRRVGYNGSAIRLRQAEPPQRQTEPANPQRGCAANTVLPL